MTVGVGETLVGRVVHYYPRISVGVVELTDGNLTVGDVIHIEGRHTKLIQDVESIQLDHRNIHRANQGNRVGIKVKGRVRHHDKVGVARWILSGPR